MSGRLQVLIPLAAGFEETEAIGVADVLSRAGVHPTLVHLPSQPSLVVGSHRIAVQAEGCVVDRSPGDYGGLFLPGGLPGTTRLAQSREVRELVTQFYREGTLIAAICAAPSVLYSLGLLAGKRVTSHPSMQREFAGCTYETLPVVVDRPFVTSRGPGTALLCGLTIVACLRGVEVAAELASAMVVEVPDAVRREWDAWDSRSS